MKLGDAVRDLAQLLAAHLEAAEKSYSDEGSRRRRDRGLALARAIETAWPAEPARPAAATPAAPRVPERLGGPLRSRPPTERTHFIVRRPLRTPNLLFEAGEAFPVQDVAAIRSYGPAYGIADADTRAITDLDYVELRVPRESQRSTASPGPLKPAA